MRNGFFHRTDKCRSVYKDKGYDPERRTYLKENPLKCRSGHHRYRKRIISDLVLQRDDVVILDMEAGLEHLGRGTTSGMDQFIVMIEPGARCIQTYRNVKRLTLELGVKQVKVVANKIRDEKDEQFILEKIPAEDFLGFIHYHPSIMEADRLGKSPYDCSPELVKEVLIRGTNWRYLKIFI